MKIKSKIIMSLLALGLVSSASAVTTNVVYLTGSTAFRGNVYNALVDNSGDAGAVFDAGSVNAMALIGNTNASKCNYMLIYGTISNTPTIFDCAWSGSEAGIASASGITIYNTDRTNNPIPLAGSPETWLKADGTVTTAGAVAGSPTAGQLEASSHPADLAQADTSQAVSLTPNVPNTSTDLHDFGVEGIVTFTWAKNYNTSPSTEWNDLVNISIEQAFVELSDPQTAAFFTGNAADTNETVYLVGRNKGSGTRANTLSDTGYGTTTAVQQFSVGGGVQPGDPTPAGTLLLQSEANNGYESGGGVAGALGINGSCGQTDPFTGQAGWIAIGYLGCSDALTAPLSTADWLTEDGVFESDGAIEQGQYSFWGHEHLYGSHGISGYQFIDGQKLHDAVAGQLGLAANNPAAHSSGIALKYMDATKGSDVAYPVHN
jgi:hypothetical protein